MPGSDDRACAADWSTFADGDAGRVFAHVAALRVQPELGPVLQLRAGRARAARVSMRRRQSGSRRSLGRRCRRRPSRGRRSRRGPARRQPVGASLASRVDLAGIPGRCIAGSAGLACRRLCLRAGRCETKRRYRAWPRTPQVGEQAPDFELPGTDGPFKLSDHRGERVVLLFYPGDNTMVCTKQFCSYRDRAEDFAALTRPSWASPRRTSTSHEGFIAKHGLNVPLLADVDKDVARSLQRVLPAPRRPSAR